MWNAGIAIGLPSTLSASVLHQRNVVPRLDAAVKLIPSMGRRAVQYISPHFGFYPRKL